MLGKRLVPIEAPSLTNPFGAHVIPRRKHDIRQLIFDLRSKPHLQGARSTLFKLASIYDVSCNRHLVREASVMQQKRIGKYGDVLM